MSTRRSKAKKLLDEGKLNSGQIPQMIQTDMPEELQKEVLSNAVEIFCGYKLQKDRAMALKQRMDSIQPQSTWHCIVGDHYATSITHQTNYLAFFNCHGQNVLLFKTQE